MSEHECPSCERAFGTERGMKIHHKRTHGESISGFKIVCENCGDEFTARTEDRKFCSKACKSGSRRVTLSCENCGDSFEVQKHKSDQDYCSRKCATQDRDNELTSVSCAGCGQEIERYPSQLERAKEHFCSTGCRKKGRKGECDYCGENIHIIPAREDLKNHYCDMECFNKDRTQPETHYTVECAECGDKKEIYRSRYNEYSNFFCDSQCRTEYLSNQVVVDCNNCGKSISRQPAALERHDKNFCSGECHKEFITGDNHPNAKEWPSVTCWWCEDEYQIKPSRKENQERFFCSHECHGDWRSWNNIYPQDPDPDYDMPRWEFKRLNDELTHKG